jgi:hypothetical protein
MQSNTTGIPVARQSALDKAKADAKARRLRDEKEAASALEDFVKEFDADIADDTREWKAGGTEGGMLHSSTSGSGGRVVMSGGARRHFTAAPRQTVLIPALRKLTPQDESHRAAGKKRNLDSFLEEIKRFLDI